MQRDLVQWNLTQMNSHNTEYSGSFLAPVIALDDASSKWSSLTSGMSAEELADMNDAKSKLEHYRKLYEIFEYCESLNATMETLETRMAAENPTLIFNIYRASKSTGATTLFSEIEDCLTAYYEL
jgi:hypothetical protein